MTPLNREPKPDPGHARKATKAHGDGRFAVEAKAKLRDAVELARLDGEADGARFYAATARGQARRGAELSRFDPSLGAARGGAKSTIQKSPLIWLAGRNLRAIGLPLCGSQCGLFFPHDPGAAKTLQYFFAPLCG